MLLLVNHIYITGCTVFDTYIRPGVTETVYGNRCHCPHTIEHVVKDLERTAAVR